MWYTHTHQEKKEAEVAVVAGWASELPADLTPSSLGWGEGLYQVHETGWLEKNQD